jgi:DNA-binding transcriptional LysR family regulator
MNAGAFEVFHVVARAGSVARAAIELDVEPSTLARQVNKLEEEVGIRLFHRSGRGMVLTEAGIELLAEASRVVESLAATRRLASQLAAGGPAHISLMAQPTIAQTCFGAVGGALRQRFPRARLRLEEAYGHEILSRLQDGHVDLALLYLPGGTSSVESEPLFQERLHCVMPREWSWPQETIDIASVLDFPLMLPSSPHGLRGLVTEWSVKAGKTPRIPFECDGSSYLTRRLVRAGLGCTILPLASVQEDVAQGLVRSVPIVGDEAVRTVALATARNRAPLPGLWEMIRIIRAEISALVAEGGWPGVDG